VESRVLGGLEMNVEVKHCPNCEVEYRPIATMCADCKIALVDGPPFTIDVPIVRPWHRFFARWIDKMIILLVCLLPVTNIEKLDENIARLLLAIPFFGGWMFIEALLLSTWGTTIGKYIFRISVRDVHGNKLSFKNAFIRCLNIWFYGEGLYLGIIQLICNSISYDRLMKERVTRWDKGRFIVEHGRKNVSLHKNTMPSINRMKVNHENSVNKAPTERGRNMNKAYYLIGIVILILFVVFVWPTPYRTYRNKVNEYVITITHVNRFTGRTCSEVINTVQGTHRVNCNDNIK
jgi:hypothetical protein